MSSQRLYSRVLTLSLMLATVVPLLSAQESSPAISHRGRKYKAPPPTSHIEVEVLKDATGKPIPNAAVIFHAVKDGRDEGNLEVKTNDEGKAIIDVIPTGSSVDVQVIADGLATFAGNYMVSEPERAITVKMLKPRAQISAYTDTRGQEASRPAGVQEPNGRSSSPIIQQPQPTNHTSDPAAIAPGVTNTPASTPQNPTPRR